MAIVAGLVFLALGTTFVVLSQKLANSYFRVWGRGAEQVGTLERAVVITCLVAGGLAIGVIGIYVMLAFG